MAYYEESPVILSESSVTISGESRTFVANDGSVHIRLG